MSSASNTTTTTVLWPCDWDNPDDPVLEETLAHSYLSWSSNILYRLPPSTMIHSIIPVQFMCLIVFFAQPLSKSSLVYFLSLLNIVTSNTMFRKCIPIIDYFTAKYRFSDIQSKPL